jgi:signal transduction histidine kinase
MHGQHIAGRALGSGAVRSSHDCTTEWAQRVTRRWSADPRVLVDFLVAFVVGVLSVVDVASASDVGLEGRRPADALAYGLVIAGSASLFWRRRAPIPVLLFVMAILIVMYLREYGAFLSVLGLPALYAVAAHEEHRGRAWLAMIGSCCALLIAAGVSLLDTDEGFAYFTALSMIAFLAAGIAAGVIIRNRERIFVDTERRAAAAEADRLAEAERAVAEERSRIAREMHDVVAHSMSVIAVQAAAGREIVHANPDKAAEVFERIEGVGRESLAELRRMLGVLRGTDEQNASLTPQPGLADVATAVADSTASGVATELVVEGQQRPLPPGIELAAYRIVQEGLTNVRKHAGRSATATVRISYRPRELVVDVTDDGRGAATSLAKTGSGQGLIGMRERVEIYGGEITSGPRPGGGFTVHAVLPIVEQAAGPAPTAADDAADTVSERGVR